MRRIALIISACLTACLLTPGDTVAMGRRVPSPPPQPKAAPPAKRVEPGAPERKSVPQGEQPKLVLEEKEYDFGKLIGVEKIEHVFKFRNEGKGDLVIDKVNTSCGCTAALLSAKVVPPGGKGEIKATFNVGTRQGEQNKLIYILSNDPKEPRATITIKGFIVPPVSIEPAMVSFIQPIDAEKVRTVKISQMMNEELKLGEVSYRLNLVHARIKEEAPENGKKRYTLEISLKPDIPPGQYFENISIATNCAAKPKVEVSVRITARGDIEATPSRINLGSLSAGQEISRKITLSNTKGQPFKVERVEVENKDFTIHPAPPLPPSPLYTFTLTGKPSAPSGLVKARIIFHLDHPKQKTIEVLAYGNARRLRSPATAPERRKGGTPGAGVRPRVTSPSPRIP